MSNDPGYILLDGVARTFPSGGKALENVEFSVSQGEFVACVGPSGCGKSTLLRLLAGLDFPTEGTVRFRGNRVTGPDREILYLFQQYGKSLYPWRTVLENVLFPLRYRFGSPRFYSEEYARESLDVVGLAEASDLYPWQLSGGMQQRLAIARGLACRPSVLLCDEPFSSLDALTRSELQDLIAKLWLELKFTAVFVTHDVDEAAYLSERVIVMDGSPGRIRSEIPINLGFPRDQIKTRESKEFLSVRRKVVDLLMRKGAPSSGPKEARAWSGR